MIVDLPGNQLSRPARAVSPLRAPTSMVLQPIIDVASGRVVAAEALARFGDPAATSGIEQIFTDAHLAGWGVDLELACLRAALARRDDLPGDVWLSVNLSPDVLADPRSDAVLGGALHRVLVEITELAAASVVDLPAILADLRRRGARIAVDDVGSGYAGLGRLAELRPDVVKLDRTLVTGATGDDAAAAVIESLVTLSRRLGMRVLGEGVESMADLTLLASLGVDLAQGHAIATPSPTLPAVNPEVATRCALARGHLLDVSAPRPTSGPGQEPIHTLTAALAGSRGHRTLRRALDAAAAQLGVDTVGVSLLSGDGNLTEVSFTGTDVDATVYSLADYPATAGSLATGTILEIAIDDPRADAAERSLLSRLGMSCLLLVPLISGGRELGILEFHHAFPRRWSVHDIADARTMAEHVIHALHRIEGTLPFD